MGGVQLEKLGAQDPANHCSNRGADDETLKARIIAPAVALHLRAEKTSGPEAPESAEYSTGHFAADGTMTARRRLEGRRRFPIRSNAGTVDQSV